MKNMNCAVRLMLAASVLLVGAVWGPDALADSQMGMKIESIETQEEGDSVITSGAEFVLDRKENLVICYQRIPRRREVATIRGLPLDEVKLLTRNAERCIFGLSPENALLAIGADSVLQISLAPGENVTITGAYAPAWRGIDGNHFLLPDAVGGVGAYLLGEGKCRPPASWESGWTLSYEADVASRLLITVFPPRPFDVNQSRKTMVHTFSSKRPYPSDEEITRWSKIGPVLTLHSWIWRGSRGSTYGIEQDESWSTTTFVPKDEPELRRVISTAHERGMKVIPYMSPYYFGDSRGLVGSETMPEYLKKVQAVLAEYGFDGVYLDGLYKNDVDGSYELLRQLRRMLGDGRIIYVHDTNMPLEKISCPFIDTYATYTLTGEHTKLTEEYARWIVSNYNLGNSVGTFCYDSTRPSAEVIDLLLCANARLPYWVQDGTWSNLKYYLEPDEVELLNREYFPRLNRDDPRAAPAEKP